MEEKLCWENTQTMNSDNLFYTFFYMFETEVITIICCCGKIGQERSFKTF